MSPEKTKVHEHKAKQEESKVEHAAEEKIHEHSHEMHTAPHTEHSPAIPPSILIMIGAVVVLILFNQYQISGIASMASGGGGSLGFVPSGGSSKGPISFSGKGGIIIGPQINPDGRTVKLVEWPTISETPKLESTGNPTQDAINYVIPKGTPWYLAEGPGAALGISFDDPITAQKVLGSLENKRSQFKIDLSPEQEQRYNKIQSVFTCDYCCGGPNAVTTINRCGCAHAAAWRGIARFFIKNYGDKYSDEQILGEMTRWKASFYPKGVVQNYLVYTGQADVNSLNQGGVVGIRAQFAGQGSTQGAASVSDINSLPGMVGGC